MQMLNITEISQPNINFTIHRREIYVRHESQTETGHHSSGGNKQKEGMIEKRSHLGLILLDAIKRKDFWKSDCKLALSRKKAAKHINNQRINEKSGKASHTSLYQAEIKQIQEVVIRKAIHHYHAVKQAERVNKTNQYI